MWKIQVFRHSLLLSGRNFMGLLGTRASSFSDLVLIAQKAGFLILFLGFIYANKCFVA